MRQRSAGRFMRADTLNCAAREARRVVDGKIALGDVVDQQLPVLLSKFRKHAGPDCTSGVASHRGVELGYADLAAGDSRNAIKCGVRPLSSQRMALRIAHQYLSQRAYLCRFV